MLTEAGGVASEFTVTRIAADRYYLTSAALAERHDEDVLRRHAAGFTNVEVVNRTEHLGVLGLAGPEARSVLGAVTDADLDDAAFPWLSARTILRNPARNRARVFRHRPTSAEGRDDSPLTKAGRRLLHTGTCRLQSCSVGRSRSRRRSSTRACTPPGQVCVMHWQLTPSSPSCFRRIVARRCASARPARRNRSTVHSIDGSASTRKSCRRRRSGAKQAPANSDEKVVNSLIYRTCDPQTVEVGLTRPTPDLRQSPPSEPDASRNSGLDADGSERGICAAHCLRDTACSGASNSAPVSSVSICSMRFSSTRLTKSSASTAKLRARSNSSNR